MKNNNNCIVFYFEENEEKRIDVYISLSQYTYRENDQSPGGSFPVDTSVSRKRSTSDEYQVHAFSFPSLRIFSLMSITLFFSLSFSDQRISDEKQKRMSISEHHSTLIKSSSRTSVSHCLSLSLSDLIKQS